MVWIEEIHCGVDRGDLLCGAWRGFTVVRIEGLCALLRFYVVGIERIHCGVHGGDSLWCALRGFTVVRIEEFHCGVD